MNILITGGAGFIGSWLADSLMQKDHNVIIYDALSNQIHGKSISENLKKLKLNPKCTFMKADIRNISDLDLALEKSDTVVHLAAETGTGQSMYQIAHYYAVNQQATAAMFESIATKHKHIRKIVLASSRSVYGEGAYLMANDLIVPTSRGLEKLKAGIFEPLGPNGEALKLIATPEYAPTNPASFYAATKLANETMGRIFSDAYDMPVIALRFQNVYGEGQSLNNPYTGILSIFSNRFRQNLPINIFEDGKESRDFVHVSDVVNSIELALQESIDHFATINIGSGIPTTVLEVAQHLKETLNSKSELIVSGDFRVGDIRHCYADLDFALKKLGYAPKVSLAEGVKAFSKWVCKQPIIEDQSREVQKKLMQLGLGQLT